MKKDADHSLGRVGGYFVVLAVQIGLAHSEKLRVTKPHQVSSLPRRGAEGGACKCQQVVINGPAAGTHFLLQDDDGLDNIIFLSVKFFKEGLIEEMVKTQGAFLMLVFEVIFSQI